MPNAGPKLTTRQRRTWMNKLVAAADAVEQAEDNLAQIMREAVADNFPYSGIEVATGRGPVTVRNIIKGEPTE